MRCDERFFKIYFHFFHHKIIKLPRLSPYCKCSMYSCWSQLLCVKKEYSKNSIFYWILQFKVYRDAGKGNVNCRFCHNCNFYSFHVHNIIVYSQCFWFIKLCKESKIWYSKSTCSGHSMSKYCMNLYHFILTCVTWI